MSKDPKAAAEKAGLPPPVHGPEDAELFLACVIYKSCCNGLDEPENLWEESFVILRAEDEQAAEQAAQKLGVENETSYQAVSGDWIDWKFFRVDFVAPLHWPLASGAEVCSRFFTRAERPGIGFEPKPTAHVA